MTIITYDAVDDIIDLVRTKWSSLRPPHITKVWEKRTVGFIDDRSDEIILSPKGENIQVFGLGGSAFWHEQIMEMDIRTYQDIKRHDKVVKEVVKIIKENIVGATYTDLRVIGSFSRNFQYRNMYSYVITLSYRKANPA
jgi:hypothetical protein|tara:strand:- start:2165 stop:2581 length:417 start_codon:yes stop_codon:yes gene_type:complete